MYSLVLITKNPTMKISLKLLALVLFLSTTLLLSCKKDKSEDIQYTETIVPLTAMGYTSVPAAVIGQYFIRQLPAKGGKPPYTWRVVSGSLPPGLSVGSNGQVSGTPTTTGEFSYTLELKDSKGSTASGSYSQKIGSSGTVGFLLLPPEIPAFGTNHDVGYLFFAQGGTPPWRFTITGLPSGVTYDPSSGLISGSCASAFTGVISISLKDALGAEASGSPATASFSINPPVPTGGTGGGTTGCNSCYNGNYIGEFKYVYYVKDANNNYNPVEGGFQLTLTLKCLATAAGSTVLNVTKAVCSDANFGCQLGGCAPVSPTVATLPASPPTTPSNLSTAGQGILLFFPNGATIMTNNGAGALNVTTSGRILSNSLDPSFQNSTWTASGGSFPSSSVPPGGPVTEFKSWSLVWSATK